MVKLNKLIQLIGPQDSGKTELRRRMCPDAIDISLFFQSGFNAPMADAPGYYFEGFPGTDRARNLLNHWLNTKYITITRIGKSSIGYQNPGVFIYEGLSPLHGIEHSLIWEVNKYV